MPVTFIDLGRRVQALNFGGSIHHVFWGVVEFWYGGIKNCVYGIFIDPALFGITFNLSDAEQQNYDKYKIATLVNKLLNSLFYKTENAVPPQLESGSANNSGSLTIEKSEASKRVSACLTTYLSCPQLTPCHRQVVLRTGFWGGAS